MRRRSIFVRSGVSALRASAARALGVTIACVGALVSPVVIGCAGTSNPGAIEGNSNSVDAPRSTAPGVRSDPLEPSSVSRPGETATLAPARSFDASTEITPWAFGTMEGRIHSTEYFRIHSTLADGSLDRALPAFSERAMMHYRTALAPLPAPPEPLETYIFGTRNQWEHYTRERLGNSAGLYIGMGKGGFTTEGDAILYDIGRLDTLTILAHEGWHQYTQRTFKQPLPLWLEEGIACWMEAVRPGRGQSASTPFMPWRNYERFGELRNGVRTGTLISLEALLDSSPEQFLKQGKDRLLLYYAQVWALVHFLNEGENGRYAPMLRELLLDAAEGRLMGRMTNSSTFPNPKARSLHLRSRVGKWVLLEYFNPRFAEIKDQYEDFVRRISTSDASQRVWKGESPLSTAQ